MKDNMIKISTLVILTTLSFQLYAKEINDSPISSNKNRLEKLELGVAELGAERERARAIRQGSHDDSETMYSITNQNNKTTQIISNTERLEKLERGVAELGAERERARIIRQGIHDDSEAKHNIINRNDKTTRVISNTERLEKLERGVSELGAEREWIRTQIEDRR
jgi:uncharacterized protein (DUF2461 family)